MPYWEVLAGRRTAMYGDVNDLHVPMYTSVWRTIRAGHWPWWTQNVFGGHSMVGAAQYAVFYPFNAVFGFLDPPTAYRWWMLGHIWLAAAGAFAWSWHRWRSRSGAIVSGVAYALNGFAVLHLVHASFLAAVAWLPFAFLGIDLVSERWSWPRAALVAMPIALIAFLGHPQLVWMATAGCALYSVALLLTRGRTLAATGRVAGAIACGLGIGAIQLLPLLAFSRTSIRPALSMSASFEHSVTPHHLLLFGFPYLFGGASHGTSLAAKWTGGDLQQEVGNYFGITILAAAVVGVVVQRRNRVVQAFVAMTLAAVLFAMGRSTPFGRLAYFVVPGAKEFRSWGRTLWLANLAVSMLAGLGVRELLRAPQRVGSRIALGAAGLGVFVTALPHIGALRGVLATGSAGTIARWSPVTMLLALAGAVGLAAIHRRAGMVAILVVCALDMVSFANAAPWYSASMSKAGVHALYDASPPPFGTTYNASGGIDRWVSDSYIFRSLSLAKNLYGINGYDPLLQKDWAETAGDWRYDGNPTRASLWEPGWSADVLRVTTLVLTNDAFPPDHSWRRDGAVPGIDFTRWIRTPRLAESYLVGAVDLRTLPQIRSELTDPYANLRASAYVERRTTAMAALGRPGSAGTVESADLLGSGRIVVNARRDALLVVSQDWERGWHATVDGKSVPVLRTDGLVIGLTVPRGRHVVRIAFTPPGLRLGALVALLATLALFLAAPLRSLARRVVSGRRRRRPGRRTSSTRSR
ncbi:MAG: hypothetical protein QOG50_148, partial [Actinomycetota bacterium]|nr:hypothetical protein [Actinomycetota bacterium]